MNSNEMLEFIIGVLESHSDWINQQNIRNDAFIKIINEQTEWINEQNMNNGILAKTINDQTDQINLLTSIITGTEEDDGCKPTIH